MAKSVVMYLVTIGGLDLGRPASIVHVLLESDSLRQQQFKGPRICGENTLFQARWFQVLADSLLLSTCIKHVSKNDVGLWLNTMCNCSVHTVEDFMMHNRSGPKIAPASAPTSSNTAPTQCNDWLALALIESSTYVQMEGRPCTRPRQACVR